MCLLADKFRQGNVLGSRSWDICAGKALGTYRDKFASNWKNVLKILVCCLSRGHAPVEFWKISSLCALFIHLHKSSSTFSYLWTRSFIAIHIHLPSLTFTHLKTPSFPSIDLHYPSYTFIQLHPRSFTFINLHLPSYNLIHLHSPSMTFMNLHESSSSFISLHFPQYAFIFRNLPS